MQPTLNRTRALKAAFLAGHYDLMRLNPKQVEALAILRDSETFALLFGGGANGGKSWLGCSWLMFMCMAFPGTRWFIGREELKRLRESTLITFYKVGRAYGIEAGTFKYNGQDHYIQFANGSRIDLLELKYLPSDPLYERYGSVEYTGGWIEEGGETAFEAYDTLKSRVGRQFNDMYGLVGKILITCNPKKNWLYTVFYKPYREGALAKGLRFLQSLVQDNLKRESGAIEALQAITDKAKKERLLFGNWEYDDDPAALMTYDAITDIFTNQTAARGQRYITADVARFGSDKAVIKVWDGLNVIKIETLSKKKTTEVAQRIRELQREFRVQASHTAVDEDGVGGGVVDMLPGIKGFLNNATPISNGRNKEQFTNLKSQCYFKLAEYINEGKIAVQASPEVQQLLTEELEQVKQKDMDTDGKKSVVPKDKVKELLGRSPDFSDTLMMRMYWEVQPSRAGYTVHQVR